jgi:hypothetical protein
MVKCKAQKSKGVNILNIPYYFYIITNFSNKTDDETEGVI